MSKFIGLLVILLALAFARWAFFPRHHLPVHRVMTTNLRLRLRVHPGRGFAIVGQLWATWGRFASFRESKPARPSLGFWYRAAHPGAHSVFCGRAQLFHGLRLAIQYHLTLFGPPRSGKTQVLARIILRYPGAVVSTTTKDDIFRDTSGIRSRRRGPVWVFNPQGIGAPDAASTVRWDPIAGCQDPAVATRRALAMCEAVSTDEAEGGSFWSEQAGNQLRALFCAAALAGYDFSRVVTWIVAGKAREAEQILARHGHDQWAATVAQQRDKAERTSATITKVLTGAVSFFTDPALASCVLPGSGPGFDIPAFLRQRGTLYLIGESRGQTAPMAPLFAGLVMEIHWEATQLAGRSKRRRLDPPLLFALDEVAQIVPIPLPSILADSGGRGIQIITACHGLSQLQERWGTHGAEAVLALSNLALLSGLSDTDLLEKVSKLAGTASFRNRGRKDGEPHTYSQHPVAPPEVVTQLARGRALFIRQGAAPVIGKLARIRRDVRYLLTPKGAGPRGRVFIGTPADAVPALDDLQTLATALADLQADLEAAGTGPAGIAAPVPVASNGHPVTNGNGHAPVHPWERP